MKILNGYIYRTIRENKKSMSIYLEFPSIQNYPVYKPLEDALSVAINCLVTTVGVEESKEQSED
ncbi:hypothetical protein SAMN04488023_10840 [Pedobacter rhizosphaerae]|uniref:Uncharacterized protein n=1 Tax=Pedobacter rhizosphaerae TaxID=390241 RepID=A0A1H9NNU0_9SPHI|nr:hypothetical protein SAMN04488023_10840 [Pedobacter rhizosphaerae]